MEYNPHPIDLSNIIISKDIQNDMERIARNIHETWAQQRKNGGCSGMFAGYHNVRSIQFNNSFDMSDVQNMEHMFDECRNLSELDVSGFDMSQVTDMENMFSNCGITAEKAGLKIE